jgi:hypothetical protein
LIFQGLAQLTCTSPQISEWIISTYLAFLHSRKSRPLDPNPDIANSRQSRITLKIKSKASGTEESTVLLKTPLARQCKSSTPSHNINTHG